MNQSAPLVSFQHVDIQLNQGQHKSTLVKDLCLDIYPGEIVGLVGESGSGKSISALSILQLLPKPTMTYPGGKLLFRGQDVLTASENQLREFRGGHVGCVFQEPMTSLNPLHRIEKQMAESLYLHRGWSKQKSAPLILKWLHRVGLREPEKKLNVFPHQLSGGERQRVMIAMALINEPELLIADEPTTALDVTVQAQILQLIKDLQSELGMAVLFISHDLGVVRQLAEKVAVMQDGRLVETNDTETLFTQPQHSYSCKLLDAEPRGEPVEGVQDQVLLTADDIKVWFPIQRGVMRRTIGHVKAVDGVSIQVHQGETLGIVGESGSGKSTLAKAILGLEKFTGKLSFGQLELHGMKAAAWQPVRKRMQVVFQDPYGSLSPRMSVAQIIAEGLEVNNIGDEASRDLDVIATMESVGLDPAVRHRYPNEFSGGQRQRIAIARALILKPEMIILDEPTSSLDRTVQYQIIELLRRIQREQGLTYLFISHDLKVVKSLAHQVVVMKEGKVIEQGAQVFTNPQDPYTQKLVETAFAY